MEQNQSDLQELEQEPPITPRNHDKAIITLLLGAVIILVVCILFLLIRNNDQNSKLDSTYTNSAPVLPTSTPTNTNVQSDPNWENYTDTIYGFSISLPKSWYVDKTRVDENGKKYFGSSFTGSNYDAEDESLFSKWDGQVVDASKNPIKIEVAISTDNRITLEELKSDRTQTLGKDSFGVIKGTATGVRDIIIDGLPAIEIIYTTKSLYQIELVAKNNYSYYIGFYDWNGDFSSDDELLLKQVIASFKILDKWSPFY